ncbi:hypothetical protein [Novosphingobium profundi]|uniref:hypothetical protein n=1 Tax=Novosphingobium profundi TaxID=1774954 RepID=UPI001CFE76EA|nr:hypothetical protein [Novosphingobium profundi]
MRDTLRRAAGQPLALRFGDIAMLTNRLDAQGRTRMNRFLADHRAPHRAGPDATRLMEALATGLGAAWPGHQT